MNSFSISSKRTSLEKSGKFSRERSLQPFIDRQIMSVILFSSSRTSPSRVLMSMSSKYMSYGKFQLGFLGFLWNLGR